MTINPSTGLIEWPDPVEGNYLILVVFSDNISASQDSFSLTVLPRENHPPEIAALPDTIFGEEGTPFDVHIDAFDVLMKTLFGF